MRYFKLILPLLLLGGCTSYHYDIAAPDGGNLRVQTDHDLVIPADPVRLRFRQVESRCVMIIDNPTSDAVTLEGAASTIVDPTGQSRQIATQLIAPGSYVKLILPPLLQIDPQGPRLQLGFGMSVDATTDRNPKYLETAQNGQDYWEWDGDGSIRIILSFKSNNQTTRHEIRIDRIKE